MSVRERFAATRERYTICTGVPWDGLSANADEGPAANAAKPLPKFAVMFKGQKDGNIINHIRKMRTYQTFYLSRCRSMDLTGQKTSWRPWTGCSLMRTIPGRASWFC